MRTLIPFLMILSASSLHAADTYCANGTTPVPDGTGSAVRSVDVPAGSGTLSIVGVRATVAMTHPWVGDLRLVLRHPSGAEVLLLDRPGLASGGGSGLGFPGPWGCGGVNVDVTFDEGALLDAEGACETAGTAIVGGKRPLESLAAFNGLSPVGTWTLIASDLIPIDAGTLGNVCLELTTVALPSCPADLDGNGVIGGADLAIVLGAWGPGCGGCASDLNADGTVDAADLAILLGAWGDCAG